jgi:hypothetical protein
MQYVLAEVDFERTLTNKGNSNDNKGVKLVM